MTLDKVPIEEAVRRLTKVDAINANKISKLEGQIDEMFKAFTGYQEQNSERIEISATNASKISKLEGQIDEMVKAFTEYREQNTKTMSEKIESIQSLTASYYEEATYKYEESKQQVTFVASTHLTLDCMRQKYFSRVYMPQDLI
jgi:gas vesicle protein